MAAGLMAVLACPAGLFGARLALAPGEPAPGVHGTTITGEELTVVYGDAEVTVINFWARWCEPCLEEMPALDRLYRQRGADALRVIGVTQEDAPGEVLAEFVGRLGVSYPILRQNHKVTRAWGGISTLPATFVVDRNGLLVRRYLGATPEEIAGLLADLEALLDGRPLGPMVLPKKPESATPPPASAGR